MAGEKEGKKNNNKNNWLYIPWPEALPSCLHHSVYELALLFVFSIHKNGASMEKWKAINTTTEKDWVRMSPKGQKAG